MKRFIFIVVAVLFLMGFPHSVFAGLFFYDEFVDGDLPWSFGSPLTLNQGSNVVNGYLTYSNAPGISNDFDVFFFRIPSYSLLTDVKLDLGVMPFSTGHIDSTTFGLTFPTVGGNPSTAVRIMNQSVNVPSTGNSLFDPVLPILPYDLAFTTDGGGSGTLAYGEYSRLAYQATFEVSSIPEPATLLLLGTGLAGAFLRKRKI